MATPTENVVLKQLSATTTLSNKNLVSVLNSHADENLTVSTDGGTNSVTLKPAESLTLQSSTGFALPDVLITLAGGGTADVIIQ